MGNRILLWFCAPFVVLGFLRATCGSALSFLICTVALSVICLVLLLHGGKRKACAALCIGVCFSFIWQSMWFSNDRLPKELYTMLPELDVRAVSYSERTEDEKDITFEAEILDVGKSVRAWVCVSDCDENISPNDIVHIRATLKQFKNDEFFAEKTYYKTRDIDVMLFASEMKITERATKITADILPRVVAKRFKDKICELYGEEEGAILKSLLLGDRSDISDEFYNALRASGLAHAVSVSGMHIAFIVGFLIIFSKNKYFKLLAIPVIFLFAIIVGAPQSALRAVIMQTLVILSHIFMRESDSLTNVSFGAFLLTMINPYCVSDIGVILSFGATTGIVVLYERIMTPLMRLAPKRKGKGRKLCAIVFSVISVFLSASLMTSPITAHSFGRISLVAPLSNVLMNGVITVAFVAGFLSVILGFVYMPLAKGVAFVIKYLILFMKNAIMILAKLPASEIFTGDVATVFLIAFLCTVIVISILLGREKIRLRHTFAIVATAFVVLFLFLAIIPEKIPEDRIRFDVLDVGQGQCIVATMGDECVIVDCGGDKPADNICISHLLKCGVKDIDKLILTHSHNDHTNGVPYLLSVFDVREICVPSRYKEDEDFSALLQIADDAQITYVEEDMDMELADMKISLLALSEDDEENEDGLSVLIADGDYELLITGDIPSDKERELLSRLPDCESYIAGHHGAASSSSLALLNKALPELCVVSAGLDNKYGHPSDNVLLRFQKIGAKIGRTDIDGTITFYSE